MGLRLSGSGVEVVVGGQGTEESVEVGHPECFPEEVVVRLNCYHRIWKFWNLKKSDVYVLYIILILKYPI